MKTIPPLPTPPAPSKMADDLLNATPATEMTLDHFSETQGRRVLQLMKSAPADLLREMWTTRAQIVRQTLLMAKERGMVTPAGTYEMTSELVLEASQALFPAVETPEQDELTLEQRRRLFAWLESHDPAPAR